MSPLLALSIYTLQSVADPDGGGSKGPCPPDPQTYDRLKISTESRRQFAVVVTQCFGVGSN